ncbi:hypothetical protein FRC09_008969 [Ceratobasidium sp. 395]|nr:hypothetical protein FRC09_008969 [Ceratobasidium sp. 395]
MYHLMAFTLLVMGLLAQSTNAMDMPGMSGSSSSEFSGAMMIPYLHFTGGDYLYFAGIAPTSKGAIAGACIALVFLAILERAVAGARGIFELKLAERKRILAVRKQDTPPAESGLEAPVVGKDGGDITSTPGSTLRSSPTFSLQPLPARRQRVMAPLLWTHDLARSALFVIQSFFLYAIMLGVMSFNAGYIISIIAGSAIGEVLFGRFIVTSGH